ncbi:hypothetical protein J6TS1_27920 [Siminovitchia terrae]|uniref:Uncharacterized protein n=1 Tax=Siminovitchia terrae TaxID=1914933 RepID=A0ABQ4L031_SIMTE|nr:hypothetical protein [Siminovitchia terrae]GIN96922.1 hypothetical protein J6TS1_27920 [Siminovitchia terrae]
MRHFKKNTIIGVSALIGVFAVGGIVYGFNKQHTAQLNQVKQEIKSEQTNLQSIQSYISQLEDKDGYLSSEATIDKLNEYEKSLNSIKDSHSDYKIKKDDLKNEIEVMKIDKQDLTIELEAVKKKIELQEKVNSLFIEKTIEGSSVKSKPVANGIALDTVTEISNEALKGKDDGTAWFKSIQELVDDAISQLNQIEIATNTVSKLVDGDKVVKGVSRKGYDKATKEVNKVKNADVKKDLTGKLDKVLAVVEKNEEKEAKRLAKLEQERAEKERQAAIQQSEQNNQQQVNQNTGSSNSVNNNTSNSGTTSGGNYHSGGSSNGSVGNSNGGGSSYTAPTQKPSYSAPSNGGSSNGGGSNSNQYKAPSKPTAPSNPAPSNPAPKPTPKPSNPNPSGGNNFNGSKGGSDKGKTYTGTKDSEGKITNSGNTWESGTFQID